MQPHVGRERKNKTKNLDPLSTFSTILGALHIFVILPTTLSTVVSALYMKDLRYREFKKWP